MPLVAPDQFPAVILAHPKIVTIAYAGDPLQGPFEQLADQVGSSDWWKQTTSEYCTNGDSGTCIGAATVLAHVTIGAEAKLPTKLAYRSIAAYLQSLIDAAIVPPPTEEVIYTFLFPSSIDLSEPGFVQCQDFGGYHDVAMVTPPSMVGGGDAGDGGGFPEGGSADKGGIAVPIAVIPRCPNPESFLATALTHEWLEAATDPIPDTGYNVHDEAFASFFYPEVGDLCDFEEPTMLGSGFTVNRGFSNRAASAGKNPCVPHAAGEVYFGAAPAQSMIELAVGESKTIDVMAFSESELPDWELAAFDLDTLYYRPSHLQIEVDKHYVHNGITAHVTVTLLEQPPRLPGARGRPGVAAAVASRQGKTTHYWPFLVLAR